MRTTASYDLFPDARSERALARARWLAREGRMRDAQSAYDQLLTANPELKACWAEYFELLRTSGKADEALQLADRARATFGETGFSYTLRGAALTELGRYPEALAELERAVEADPDLGLVWHELGYAAYKLGDRNRALLALDRAFALEPHTDTLKLRGHILREAGRYQAAEVAFEGAAQAAEHAEQRADAEREIATTRRYAVYTPRRPEDLTPAERWFADTGAVVLASTPGPVPPSDETLVATFAEVAANSDWHFGQVILLGPEFPACNDLAERMGAPLVTPAALDPGVCPLIVGLRPLSSDRTWNGIVSRLTSQSIGLVFALEHPAEALGADVTTDVIGVLTDAGRRRERAPNPAHALADAQNPGARLAGRRLKPS
ncbi:MAG TPA: tetratricopeptide repeat protein [Gemmatimonadales bacterium]|nr:tetratricopeptide repeat protein [Gemmatimonadales bacterium]